MDNLNDRRAVKSQLSCHLYFLSLLFSCLLFYSVLYSFIIILLPCHLSSLVSVLAVFAGLDSCTYPWNSVTAPRHDLPPGMLMIMDHFVRSYVFPLRTEQQAGYVVAWQGKGIDP